MALRRRAKLLPGERGVSERHWTVHGGPGFQLRLTAASIIVSFTFQLVFFQDYPNTLKIIGLCVVILSILLLGGHKIIKHRKDNAKI